jgi:hypothetical protein
MSQFSMKIGAYLLAFSNISEKSEHPEWLHLNKKIPATENRVWPDSAVSITI